MSFPVGGPVVWLKTLSWVALSLDIGEIMAAEFTKESFESEVLGANIPVLVDFWSEG